MKTATRKSPEQRATEIFGADDRLAIAVREYLREIDRIDGCPEREWKRDPTPALQYRTLVLEVCNWDWKKSQEFTACF
jgi:hypothetical protein